MTADDLNWLVGLLLPQIGLAASLIGITLSDKLRHPLRAAISLHSAVAVIESVFAYLVTGNYWASIIIVLVAILSVAIIIYVLKQRDIKGINLGEHFIEFERVVDFQISYVLNLVERNLYSQIRNAIQQAL